MKGPTETEITKNIRKLLKGLGIFHWKQWQGPMSQPKGVSDILGITKDKWDYCCEHCGKTNTLIIPGKSLAIEVKRDGEDPTENQQIFLDNVSRAGGIAFVARSVDDVIEALGLRDRFK